MSKHVEPKAIPPKGSAWAASLAEPKHKVWVEIEPQTEAPETIRVAVDVHPTETPETIRVVVFKPEANKP